MSDLMKFCSGCGQRKPAIPEFWHLHHRYGFQSECKECMRRKNREFYRGDRDTQKERGRVNYWKSQGQEQPPLENQLKPRKPPVTDLEKAIEAFLASRKNLAPGTVKNYVFTLFAFGKDYPAFPPAAQDVTDWLADNYKNGTSKRTKFACIRAFTRWLMKTRRLENDPLEEIVRPPKEEALPRAPRERDIQKVLDYLEAQVESRLEHHPLQAYRAARDLVVFSLMLDTGLRVSEVSRLDLLDIDLEESSALIRITKTHRERYVIFGKRVKGNLKLWLKLRAELSLPEELPALFVSEWRGWKRCSIHIFEKRLILYCRLVGVRRFSPHQLRHACAVQALARGQNIERVRQQLGHTSIAMTGRYLMLPNEGRLQDHLRTSPLDNLGRAAA